MPKYHKSFKKTDIETLYLTHLKSLKPSEDLIPMLRQMATDIYTENSRQLTIDNERLKRDIAGLAEQKNKTIGLITKGIVSEEDGRARLDQLNALIQEKKSYIVNDEALKKISDDCWDFSKFFLENFDKVWLEGEYEEKKGIQGLITPNGWTSQNNVIEPVKTPDFLSIFDMRNNSIPLKWS